MKRLLFSVGMVFFIATGVSGRTQAPQADPPTRVAVSTDAPIYIAADASRAVLRVAKVGTKLNVIGSISGWLEIEFNDLQ
jgi:hypothetical protein